jgi:hypothetical protein
MYHITENTVWLGFSFLLAFTYAGTIDHGYHQPRVPSPTDTIAHGNHGLSPMASYIALSGLFGAILIKSE